ncbi:hypothetical protein [Sorangium cellulosum]|uniref:hypothetical protein n=1 Tax=Sorangium cellulosum TaxID=56 RepID=UPI001F5C7F31|nr:hypothetical protein [Sorangium cellulosum]
MRHRREHGELGLHFCFFCFRNGRVGDLGDDGRTEHQRLDGAEAQAEVDALRRPGGHAGVRRDHEDDRGAPLPGAHARDVRRPRELLVRIHVALDLEDDRQHELAARVAQLEHQVRAELRRDELVERRLDHRDRGVRRHLDVEERREHVGRELRALTEHLDEGIVLERRHDSSLEHAPCRRETTGERGESSSSAGGGAMAEQGGHHAPSGAHAPNDPSIGEPKPPDQVCLAKALRPLARRVR